MGVFDYMGVFDSKDFSLGSVQNSPSYQQQYECLTNYYNSLQASTSAPSAREHIPEKPVNKKLLLLEG